MAVAEVVLVAEAIVVVLVVLAAEALVVVVPAEAGKLYVYQKNVCIIFSST
jgi:hypothetical protein